MKHSYALKHITELLVEIKIYSALEACSVYVLVRESNGIWFDASVRIVP